LGGGILCGGQAFDFLALAFYFAQPFFKFFVMLTVECGGAKKTIYR
jgi:hypothetical protein